MDVAHSSLEVPPPAWGREAALSEGRGAVLEGNAAVTRAAVVCVLTGLALMVGLHPPLQSAAGMTALVLGVVSGSALTARLVRVLRQRGR